MIQAPLVEGKLTHEINYQRRLASPSGVDGDKALAEVAGPVGQAPAGGQHSAARVES